jgi:hypothetical protein
MRIVVLSGSGNTGKTVIAEHLLAPRLEDALVICFGGVRDQAMRGHWLHREDVSAVFADLLEHERCIVDIAGSATPGLLAGIHRFASIHQFVDYFVIPVTNSPKVQLETISILERLVSFGVEANRIRIVFNRVNSSVEAEFGLLLNHVSEQGGATANTKAAVFENELFDILGEEHLTIRQVLEDETDYKTLLRENKRGETEQWEDWANRFGIKSLSKHINRNLDTCYAELFS